MGAMIGEVDEEDSASLMSEIEALRDDISDLESKLARIASWCNAYPVEVFVPITQDERDTANKALRAVDVTPDRLHASWARHILDGIRKIIDGN